MKGDGLGVLVASHVSLKDVLAGTHHVAQHAVEVVGTVAALRLLQLLLMPLAVDVRLVGLRGRQE